MRVLKSTSLKQKNCITLVIVNQKEWIREINIRKSLIDLLLLKKYGRAKTKIITGKNTKRNTELVNRKERKWGKFIMT
jgi:hypothetical protein